MWDSDRCADSSATWADIGQTIKPRIILLDPPRQIVFPGVDLVSANSLVLACLDWLPMADDGLHVGVFLRLGSVHNRHRCRQHNNSSKNRAHDPAPFS